jgi:hypothetical protein
MIIIAIVMAIPTDLTLNIMATVFTGEDTVEDIGNSRTEWFISRLYY